ncbi:MAG: radical SAM protein [Melioribacteraceae bacterium]
MYFSKYNIFSKIRNSDDYYLVNLLSGNADILQPVKANEILNGNYGDIQEYLEKGYLIDENEEKKIYMNKYLEFIENRDKDEVQIFFVPWYACNFGCAYCYQSGYDLEKQSISKEVIDAFFSYVKKEFAGKRKYITVFGGEPLLPAEASRKSIEYILQQATENGLDTALVTNGFSLKEYTPLLTKYRIREVQVTLDGLGEVHNTRRPLKNGGETFAQIVEGIDEALANKININLRVVIDKENLNSLVDLSKFAVEKGWTNSQYFKTQLGRNYELHYCQSSQSRLFTRLEFYEAIYSLIEGHPEITEFHKPAFSVSKFLFDNGELPAPLFDDCTGCKTEWAFDGSGHIYACTATVGKKGEELGTFYPTVNKANDLIKLWEERDVTTIPECKSCNLQLACGGGCASIAKNRTGTLASPDCRPITQLLEMGISHYFCEK